MTQAVLNNLINTVQQTVNDKIDTKDFTDKSFQKLLDKQADLQKDIKGVEKNIENTEGTIGAFKEDAVNKFNEFKNILRQSDGETAEETSMDLTLTEDIEEAEEEDIEIVENSDPEITDETDKNNTTITNEEDTTLIKETTYPADTAMAVMQTVVPQNQIKPENIEMSDEDTDSTDDMQVTLNGKDIDTVLKEFETDTAVSEELPVIKPVMTEETQEAEGKTLEELVDERTLEELNVESVETETSQSDDNTSDLMNQQSPEEQGVKAMLQTDADFSLEVKTEIKPTANVQNTAKTLSEANPGRIIEQISRQLENMTGGSKVNIVLNPESLGKVSLQLINTKEGLSAQFTVATQDAKNLLMKGLDGLKDTLIAHGVSVDNVSVKMNDTQDTSYNADWTEQEGSRGGNKEQGARKEQQERESFEQMMSFVQDEEK